MTLNLWDCGGQDVFMDNYFTTQKDHIFKMVQVLIHVFDVELKSINKDIEIFVKALTNLQKFSPDAKIFVLLHKMDLVQLDKREELFHIMMDKLQKISNPFQFKLVGFPTSIWDESLYKAWSQIVCSLIPNMNLFNSNLLKFNEVLDAEEIILFEKTTFLSLGKLRSNFQNLVIRGSNGLHFYIDFLTDNLFIMIVLRDRGSGGGCRNTLEDLLILENVKLARKWFEKIEGGK
ncbi:hypothetical protein HF325_001063 [Metschnikowia pulcherrima]|uniref:GTP-binding protein n=1 Tax=Metschnikowia pulcherrima TaxID=27326 RepID=A0A8H7LDI0_9ASCO|nr:hypothetical protein HF325_001063 [Metschnikowia pulcherrima]